MQQKGRDALRSKAVRTPKGSDLSGRFGVFNALKKTGRSAVSKLNLLKVLISTSLCKKAILVIALLLVPGGVLFSSFNPGKASAAPASNLNFQARLLTNTGNLVPDGTYNIEFKLYDAASAGTLKWTDTRYDQNGVTAGLDYRISVTNGYFSVNLADTSVGGTAFPSTIDWSSELWLTMNIGGTTQTATPTWDGEMSPRIKLTAVPLAFMANNVNSGNTTAASTNSANTTIQSGNATGVTSNSGNVVIDAGTATGTTGTISLGATSASSLLLGRSAFTTLNVGNLTVQGGTTTLGTTTVAGNLIVSDGSSSTITFKSAAQVAAVNYDITVPAITANDTLCLVTAANCGGSGDSITINGSAATDANFLNTAASASVAGTTFAVNTASNPDDITLTVSDASGTLAGIVTANAQTFGGDKTFNGTITVGGAATTGTITLGQATTAATQTIDISSANGTASTQTVNIAGGTSTTSGGKIVNIANGVPGASTTNTVAIGTGGSTTGTVGITIGSIGAATHTTLIQGGNGASAISLQAAASGTISIGTTNNNNLSLNTSAIAGTTIIGGTATTGTITLGQSTATNTVNIANAATATGNTQTINIGAGTPVGTGLTNITIGNVLNGGALNLLAGTGNINLQASGTAAVARIQIGAGGAGSTTPDYLALDVKSDTGDPAGGAEGYMYYNTLDNKFRCYEATAWKDCDTGSSSTAGNDIDITGSQIDVEAQLDFVTTINRTSASLTLQTTTSGDILVNAAGSFNVGTGDLVVNSSGNTTVGGTLTVGNVLATTNITIGTSDTTGTLLVLDTKTDATDPTGVQGAMYYNSNAGKFRCYEGAAWKDCITTGGGSSKVVRFIPEYAGGVLSPDGSSNSGTLIADFVSGLSATEGEKHNFYQWSTAQTSVQDYDVILNVQIPSDFATIGAASTFKFWMLDPDVATTTAKITWTILDDDETSCFSTDFNGATSATWQQFTASTLGTCSFAANNTMTVKFKLVTTSAAGSLKLGAFEFGYSL